jgi:hypothetical protein
MEKNMIEANIVADSISEDGVRITTLQLRYHRYIHAEFMTHRVFSRSASSSRAIPIKTIIGQVWNDPATPVHWGANRPGMQAKEQLTGWRLFLAKSIWLTASKFACVFAYLFYYVGLHKQIGNRILEPWQFINVIVTSTEWDNFFELRIHPDAQPEIEVLARTIYRCVHCNTPKLLESGDWHLPYIDDVERALYDVDTLLAASTARCARVSYSNHDGSNPSIEKDVALHDKLVASRPIHASPAEHQATPAGGEFFFKNFRGWVQYRDRIEQKLYEEK